MSRTLGTFLLVLNPFAQHSDTHPRLAQDRHGREPSIGTTRPVSNADGIAHQVARRHESHVD